MAKFIILTGNIKSTNGMLSEGQEIDLSPEEAERINKKGAFLELVEVHNAKAKAKSDAEKSIEAAEAQAKAKLKGGGK